MSELDILEKMEKLEELQQKLDKKTKDAEAYRDMNKHLCDIINRMLVVIIAIVLICGGVCLYCVSSLYSFENSVNRSYETVTQDLEAGSGGVLINGNGNNSEIQSNDSE
jgi:hypothetical protein